MNEERYMICLHDMVPNAFVELKKRGINVNELTIDLIEKYGDEVAAKLKKDGKKIMFGLSRTATEHFRVNYQEYFTLKDGENDPEFSVILNDGIELDELIKKFRGFLPLDLLLAYSNEEVVQKGLLDNMSIGEKPAVKKKSIKDKM